MRSRGITTLQYRQKCKDNKKQEAKKLKTGYDVNGGGENGEEDLREE